jgi:pimeloyl-ACP methyl ester carboxylesterase
VPKLDAGDTDVAYETHGSGRPLVFLHGGWLDRRLWTPQVARFADACRVVAVDLRDHGGSEHSGGRYAVPDMAADVRTVLDRLELDHPVVCGLSLGGIVAQQLATETPDRLAGLVLASTTTSFPPITLPAAAKRMLVPRAGGHLAARTMGGSAYFRSMLRWIETVEGGPWLATTAEAREYALAAVDAFSTDRFLRVFDALYGFDGVRLRGVDVPSLVVHGEHEAGAVERQNRRLARRLDAERVVVDGAGHLVNRDAPARFNETFGAFLEREAAPA